MSGVLHGVVASLKAAAAAATDAFFEYVTLLLNTSATNGAQNNTFLDSSTNNFSITRNGDTTQGSFNPYMPSGYWSGFFDGTGDYLSVPRNNAFLPGANTDFTVEAWVYMTATPGATGGRVVGFGEYGTDSDWAFYIDNTNKLALYINSVVTAYPTTINVPLNTWTHIAASRSGTGSNNLKVFINGVGASFTTNATLISTGLRNLTIGADQNGDEENFTGYISNLRFVNGTGVYTADFTPPTTPLTAITNTSLLCLQDNRFKDNSTNNFTITRNGDTRISKFAPFNPPASYSTASYGGSGYFDGAGDYLSVPRNSAFVPGANTDFTVEAWVYLTATPGSAPALIAGLGEYGTDSDWSFEINSSRQLTFYISAIVTSFTNTGTLVPLNTWTHVAASRSGTGTNNLKVFVNGVGQSFTTNSTTVGTGSRNLTIGADQNGDEANFTGYISNLRFVNGTGVYTTDFTPPTTPLTAITNTSLLLNFTNAGIYDAATINDGQTVGNAQVSTTQAKWGTTSMRFDGTGDWLSLVGGNQSRLFDQLTASGKVNTVELWLYLVSRNGSRDYLIGNCNGGSGWSYDLDPAGDVVIETGGGVTNVILSTKVSAGVWQHLAFVNNGTNIIVYLNGTNVGSTAVLSPASNTLPLTVGGRQDNSLIINGYIQDVRITNGYARYTANFTAPTAAFPTL